MTAHQTGHFVAAPVDVRSRAETYIAAHTFDRPTLVLDPEAVAASYRGLKAGLGRAHIHYAVKANPEPAILRTLTALGSGFDAASRAEIELCLAAGATPDRISFGNTVKRPADIAWAHAHGITLFAVDAEEEMDKIAAHAPGARVYIRVRIDVSQADWPLSRKFGVPAETVPALRARAAAVGLTVVGLSFHVGSQTRESAMWGPCLDAVAEIWHAAQADGAEFTLLNIGGGFPAFYGEVVEPAEVYGANVMAMIEERFGHVPHVMAEPGRGMVAEAGAISAEVLLVARKSTTDMHRWVYLDIGKFSGLAETMDEAIRYQFTTARDAGTFGPCILAGPSCDSADVLYEQRPVNLPAELQAGDRIVIRNCGAYTTTYASIGFNGFPPLDVVVL